MDKRDRIPTGEHGYYLLLPVRCAAVCRILVLVSIHSIQNALPSQPMKGGYFYRRMPPMVLPPHAGPAA